MSDDQEYYLSQRRSWPLLVRFSYEFGEPMRHLRKFRNGYLIWSVVFILFVASLTWIKNDAAVDEIPLIVLAASIHLLRGVAIVSLYFVWLSAEFIQDWFYERTSNAWIEKERMRRPGISFDVPHWRFFVPAVLVRALIFTIWLGFEFFLLYVVPAWLSGLEGFIPHNFPF